MLKILLVSIALPPKSDPESLQTGRYVKYLIKSGCSVSVITSALPTLYMESDPSLSNYLPLSVKVDFIKLLENRYLNFITRKLFPSWLQYPDSKWSFYHSRIPEVGQPDILYSRSYPLSSTLLALKIKKKLQIPWILHLSDPWALSFEGDSPATVFNPKPRKWNLGKERECFSLADKVSFTSLKTRELYRAAYPEFASKFIITPNVFDEELVSNKPPDFSGKLRIVYTGGFGEKRSPSFYLKTITEVLMESPDLRQDVDFIFVGPMTRENKKVFEAYREIKEIVHYGVIPYDQMLEYQRNAHVLVNIDTDIPSPKHSVFFPSKLLEYLAANRRVLNISNHHAVSTSVIKDKFGDYVEFNDGRSLKIILAEYWKRFRAKDAAFFSLAQSATEYGAAFNALKLIAEMKELMSR